MNAEEHLGGWITSLEWSDGSRGWYLTPFGDVRQTVARARQVMSALALRRIRSAQRLVL